MPFHMNVEIRALLELFFISLILTSLFAIGYILLQDNEPDSATYYCDPKLCNPGEHHIGCHLLDRYALVCIAPEKVTFTDPLKRLILTKHNGLRNKVASGNVSPYKSAARMLTLTWNEELAYLAFLNTKHCKLLYDQCRNTREYPHVGQNIAISHPVEGREINMAQVQQIIPELVDLWFSESKYTTQAIMDVYKYDASKSVVNFSNIVVDRTSQVGCGMSGFVSYHKKWVYLLTCDYSCGLTVGLPVYISGTIGSGCRTGVNKDFQGIIAIIVILVTIKYPSTIYCAEGLCKPGEMHIGCYPPDFSTHCISPKQVKLAKVENLILKSFNNYRDQVASGNLSQFQSASRMLTVAWNKELAYLAFLNTKSCSLEYNKCCNTRNFTNVGQSQGLSEPGYGGHGSFEVIVIDFKDISNVISTIIGLWISEKSNANQNLMASFDPSQPIRNFSNIVRDTTSQVGCGMTGFTSRHRQTVYILTCDFSTAPIPGLPVYNSGPPTSACNTGRNPDFNSLCSVDEN